MPPSRYTDKKCMHLALLNFFLSFLNVSDQDKAVFVLSANMFPLSSCGISLVLHNPKSVAIS